MKITFIAARYVCMDPTLGIAKTQWGWRIMLIWVHVCIHKGKGWMVTN